MIHVNNTIFSWGGKKCLHGCKSWESLFFSFKNKPVQVTLEKGRRLAKGQEILTRCREQGGPSLFFFFFFFLLPAERGKHARAHARRYLAGDD